MWRRLFRPGDWVIYRKTKHTTSPGRRAQEVEPEVRGEMYTYKVDKFWTVASEVADGVVEVKTRRGKVHRVRANDPNLRRANLIERILYGNRFPTT